MKVLIDTNVLLCAAFDSNSESARMFLADTIQFYYSDLTYAEIESKVAFFAKGHKIIEKKLLSVLNSFIAQNCLISLPPWHFISSSELPDGDDAAILACARHHSIYSICTYNIKDFKIPTIDLVTPGMINKKYNLKTKPGNVPYDFIAIYGKVHKTLVLSFTPSSNETIGYIFKYWDGRKYYFDPNGYLQCDKKSSSPKMSQKLDFKQAQIFLGIRWQKDYNEVIQFKTDSKSGKNSFQFEFEPTVLARCPHQGNSLQSCFGYNDSVRPFYGRIKYVLGWPERLRNPSIIKILQASSIDPIIGSTNIDVLFRSTLIKQRLHGM